MEMHRIRPDFVGIFPWLGKHPSLLINAHGKNTKFVIQTPDAMSGSVSIARLSLDAATVERNTV